MSGDYLRDHEQENGLLLWRVSGCFNIHRDSSQPNGLVSRNADVFVVEWGVIHSRTIGSFAGLGVNIIPSRISCGHTIMHCRT